MIICCSNDQNLCNDYSCKVEKTDNGITISFFTDDKNKVESLHKIENPVRHLVIQMIKKAARKPAANQL